MKRWERITVIIIVLMVAVGIIYDIIALAMGGVEATISRIILAVTGKWPIISFAFGVLCGHLLWPQRIKPKE
jgi:hypothetical protein